MGEKLVIRVCEAALNRFTARPYPRHGKTVNRLHTVGRKGEKRVLHQPVLSKPRPEWRRHPRESDPLRREWSAPIGGTDFPSTCSLAPWVSLGNYIAPFVPSPLTIGLQ